MINFKHDYSEEELKDKLLATHDLTQENWTLERGANQVKNYIDHNDNNKVKAKEITIYEWGNGTRFPSNAYKKLEWYDNDGNLITDKVVRKVPVSDTKLDDINDSIARRRIHYLENAAINLREQAAQLPEPLKTQFTQVANSIDLLFNHYRAEIQDYRDRRNNAFENAILNETNPMILSILSIPVRQPDELFPNGLTVKQSVLYQLTGSPTGV